MDHQGAGRTRSAADTRRQPPWPAPDGTGSGAQRILAPGTGPQPIQEPGTGPQRLAGPATGPQRIQGPATGPQRIQGPGTGPQRLAGPATGPQRIQGPATGPQRIQGPGTGPQRIQGPGTGPQRIQGPGTGPQRIQGPATGPQRIQGPGTGPQRLAGPASGANPVLNRGTGAQPVFNPDAVASSASGSPGSPAATGSFERAPVPGLPPGRDPTGPFPAGTSATGPFPAGPSATGPFPAGDGYRADDTNPLDLVVPDVAERAARPGRRHGSRAKRGRRFRIGWLVTAVVVAAAAGFAGYKYLYEPRVDAPVPPTLRLPTGAPESPGFDKTLGKWQHIGTRAEDPEPLTITGLYPPQFVLNGASYVRTAASATKSCSQVVYGSNLQAALQSGHCSQVVRASYISGDGTMMGTVGVVNLVNSSAAQQAGQATGPQEIIMPLTGKKGATSKLGNGTGMVQAEIKGHYLILMYAEFANLKSPSGTAQRQALEQFAANLVTGSANINLSNRMLTGKP
jgi:hypothetical protein